MTPKGSKVKKKLVLTVIASIFIAFATGEMVVRILGEADEDGNFYFYNIRVKPYKLPISSLASNVENYLVLARPFIVYDADLGWSLKPNAKSADGLYASNSGGIRSAPREVSLAPAPGKIRISIFGDSFAFCSDAPFEHSWGRLLQEELQRRGMDAEVLNFGVPGYGFDQAYLRWLKSGRLYSSDIVIFGFVAGDMRRIVNIIASVRCATCGLPFSKPRFILEKDSLELVNRPAAPPEKLVDILKTFNKNYLSKHEYYYYKPDYRMTFIRHSRLLSILSSPSPLDLIRHKSEHNRSSLFGDGPHSFFDVKSEPSRITFKIISRFKEDVEKHNAKFMIVNLPWKQQLQIIAAGRPFLYSDIMRELDKKFTIIHTEKELLKAAQKDSIDALYNGHFSFKGNQIIAETLAERILKLAERHPPVFNDKGARKRK